MRSRRDLLKVTFGLTSVQWLRGQGVDRNRLVVIRVAVTDGSGRYINSLKPSDFRIFEDGIPQKILRSAYDEVGLDYTITYAPDPSNQNQGFRQIKVEIMSDVDKQLRARYIPGYRPKKPN